MEDMNLRGLVVSKYGSISAFARKVNWSTRKARDVVTGHQNVTLADAEIIAEALGAKSAKEFASLFLSEKYTM